MLVGLVFFLGLVVAQRPSNTSTCDYYAGLRYGVSNNDTQFQLIQDIVSLAFGGGFNFSDVPSEITGILNPGTLEGLPVDLQPWFNGSIPSTNLNNQAVAINWLDDGGLNPLYDYLSNTTASVVLTNGTNQYRLFNHFLLAFSHIFGCSDPPPSDPSTGGQLNLAYVHKYMNLNYTDLGHFIDQLSRSATYYGFSDQDSQTFSTNLNSQYNVRCAPAITENPAQGPQLLSLCQADTCPLAEPNPDCAAYANLTADGEAGSASSSSLSSSSESTVALPSSTSNTAAAATSTPAAVASKSGSSLSGGAIAGIVIGGIAFLLLGLGLIAFLFRRRKSHHPPSEPAFFSPPQDYSSTTSPTPQMSYPASYPASYPTSYQPSYVNPVPPAEMESPRPPEMESPRTAPTAWETGAGQHEYGNDLGMTQSQKA